MRFYNIVLGNPKTGKVLRTYKSVGPDGAVDPGALNIVLDVTEGPAHLPAGDSYVELHGIDQADTRAASDFNFKNITISAGMSKGLPLATAQSVQQGIIVQGQIIQSYSNWVGTLMSLHMVIQGPQTSATDPNSGTDPAAQDNNLTLNWPAGVSLAQPLASCLRVGFPGYNVRVNISPKLVRPNTEVHTAGNLYVLSQYINLTTQALLGGDYQGVSIYLHEKIIDVYDGTVTANVATVALQFQDLVGQPVWLGPNTIQLQLILRGDLTVGSYVTLPDVPVITQSSAYSSFKNKPNFTGKFFVNSLRHVGDFRDPDGGSWVTVANVIFVG